MHQVTFKCASRDVQQQDDGSVSPGEEIIKQFQPLISLKCSWDTLKWPPLQGQFTFGYTAPNAFEVSQTHPTNWRIKMPPEQHFSLPKEEHSFALVLLV